MATDQGKTSNMNALGVLRQVTGTPIPEIGLTTFRPPYTPVTFGTLAGPARRRPLRAGAATPIHEWAEQRGAVFEDVGAWKRARYFPRAGETCMRRCGRECTAVRDSVGLFDASTLGKIEVVGPGRRRIPPPHVRQPLEQPRAGASALRRHAARGRLRHGRRRRRRAWRRTAFT